MTKKENELKADVLRKEFKTLTKMRMYAQYHIWDNKMSVEQETLVNDMNALYEKYADKLNEEFFELTGKVFF